MPASFVNQRLGFAPSDRLLIINADDFGLSDGVNAAIIATLEAGLVSSTSLMTVGPAVAGAVAYLLANPALPFAVHLTLISEQSTVRWGPLSDPDRVPSVLWPDGTFPPFEARTALLARADISDVEREFRAQIDSAVAAGLQPTHLDWHCLADGGRDDITELSLALADEYRLALRAHTPGLVARCRERGRPVPDQGVVDSFSLPAAAKAEAFAQLLTTQAPGLTEWAVHPGADDVTAQTLDPDGWPVRASDRAYFLSSTARDAIAAAGVRLVTYRDLRDAYQPMARA